MKMKGVVVFGTYEKNDVYNWTDPITQQIKPLRSVKILLTHGDGTVSRESLSLPPGLEFPSLRPNEVYGFPCALGVSKKKGLVTFTLLSDMAPFPAPDMG